MTPKSGRLGRIFSALLRCTISFKKKQQSLVYSSWNLILKKKFENAGRHFAASEIIKNMKAVMYKSSNQIII
jgi:hypothetical protein